MAGRDVVVYSEAFKLQVVRELEGGKLSGPEAACRRYGIGSRASVRRWLRQYGKSSSVGKVVRVQTAAERDVVKKLRGEVRRLKDALAEATVERLLAEGYLKAWCEQAGIEDVEAAKKKIGARSPAPPFSSAKGTRS